MKVLSNLMIAVKGFVVVDFPIAVEVMKASDLISAGNVDVPIDDFDPQWLK